MGFTLKSFSCTLLIAGIVFLQSCHTTGVLTGIDLSEAIRQPQGFHCRLLNVNDSLTHIYLRFPTRLLSKVKDKETGQSVYKLLINYQLYSDFRVKVPLDSFSLRINMNVLEGKDYISSNSGIKAYSGHNYILSVKVIDLNTSKTFLNILPLDKTNRFDRNWFTFVDTDGEILWESYISESQPIRIECVDSSRIFLAGKAFFHHFQAAAPPFITKSRKQFDYRVDSSFSIELNQGHSQWFTLDRQGFYYFGSDTIGENCLTLFKTYPGYPKLTTPKRMLEGLRYLTSNQEYEKLWKSEYPKEAVDSFWIANTSGADRAIEMIRRYYERMEEANRYFFSFCEGWKTDRGLIYIIFGQPNHVFRTDNEEYWIYGETGNNRSLQFAFIKVDNPFTSNDYILQRQENYKSYWYNAVKLWRR